MTETRKILTVFLASPGDLAPERELVKKHVDEWNEVNSARENWQVELLGWEDVLPGAGRPQALINKDVQRCALFIGMMWRRWGSSPGGSEQKFTSGFEEEFSLARELHVQSGRPQLAIFFKDPGPLDDAGPSLQKVVQFKRTLIEEKICLYKELKDEPVVWTDDFRRMIHKLIFDQIAQIEVSDSEEPAAPGSQASVPAAVAEVTHEPIASIGTLRRLTEELSGRPTADEISDIEIARLRLAALSIRRARLSDTHIESHDANILFAARNELKLSAAEIREMVDSALASGPDETIPLWGWAGETTLLTDYLALRASRPDEGEAIGALRTMTAISASPSEKLRDNIEQALSSFAPAAYREALMRYLGRTGTDPDLALIDIELQRKDYATAQAALSAALRIRLRASRRSAFEYALQTSAALPPAVVPEVLEAVDEVPSEELQSGLAHTATEVRAACAATLRRRGLLVADALAVARADPSAEVRLQAALADVAAGTIRSIKDAELIVRPATKLKPSLIFGIGSSENKAALLQVRRAFLESATDEELETASASSGDLAPIAYEIVGLRRFAKLKSQIRADVDSQFANHAANTRQQATNPFATMGALSLLASAPASGPVTEMLRAAVRVLTAKGDEHDLIRLRRALGDARIAMEVNDLRFLQRHGDAADIPLIKNAVAGIGATLMSAPDRDLARAAADTVYELANRDLAQVIDAEPGPYLLRLVIELASKKSFAALQEANLLALLNHQDQHVRKAAALKIGATKAKKDIRQLMGKIIEQQTYFYNAVYWLDFCGTAKKDHVAAAAQWYSVGGES